MLSILALMAMGELPNDPPTLAGKSDQAAVRRPFEPAKWNLVWRDEFNKDGAPDTRFWGYEEGYVRNNEAQYYTADRRENARVEGGKLVIEARRDNFQGKPISSASLITRGRRSFLYGRIEVRAKVPTGRGTWPAIWTLGENIGAVGWPKCGEIDIMEYVGMNPGRIHGNIHVDAYNHTKGNGRGGGVDVSGVHERFHVWAVEWSKEKIDFFFDDLMYFSYKNEGTGDAVWPFDKPQYLILNLAIGGAWGGQQGIDDTLFPHRFEVDYVRYYMPKK